MIHVIGNATIDTVIRVKRLPNPGETVIADGAAEDVGGKGLNQAIIISRSGLPVRLLAAIGGDPVWSKNSSEAPPPVHAAS